MPKEVRWFQEVGRSDGSPTLNESVRAVLDELRAKPGPWKEHSRHVSKGACQVAAARWRKRWAGEADQSDFHVKVRNLPENADTDRPWSLLMAYRPTVEHQP